MPSVPAYIKTITHFTVFNILAFPSFIISILLHRVISAKSIWLVIIVLPCSCYICICLLLCKICFLHTQQLCKDEVAELMWVGSFLECRYFPLFVIFNMQFFPHALHHSVFHKRLRCKVVMVYIFYIECPSKFFIPYNGNFTSKLHSLSEDWNN